MSKVVDRVFAAVVTDVRLESRAAGQARWRIALDHTEFDVGETGELEAVAKSGARLVAPVLEVVADAGSGLWHVVQKPLTEGTEVIGRVMQAE